MNIKRDAMLLVNKFDTARNGLYAGPAWVKSAWFFRQNLHERLQTCSC